MITFKQAKTRADRSAPRPLLRFSSLLLGLFVASIALAGDRLKDFQNAINYMQDDKACFSIPYPDPQNTCRSKQPDVKKYCDDSGERRCDASIDPKRVQADIEKLKTERDTLKTEKEKLQQNKSEDKKQEIEGRIKEIDSRLYALERSREALQKEVEKAKQEIKDRIYIGKACEDSRAAVRQAFESAKRNASAETESEIAPLAKRLVDWWIPRERGHDDQIQNARRAVDKCTAMLDQINYLGSF